MERINLIKKAYKIVFREKHKIAKAIEFVKALPSRSKDVQILLDFLEKSERGLTR
jgi:acyl-[acyl carrier protein]--UDP-N-acetylglucosamine O-acyltransferase